MGLTRKDAAATGLMLLSILVFAAAHQGWGVPLVGGSVRWAAVVVTVLGAMTCGLGSPAETGGASLLLSALGVAALALSVVAIVTGSLTVLSLLVVDELVLWVVATLRHAGHAPAKPLAT